MKSSRLLLTSLVTATASLTNSTYYNPVLPGWHSDPSCVHVNGTFLCATSTFLVFPGLPIYASKDLIHWKLASHAWTRPEQFGLPNAARNGTDFQSAGFFAPNLRYHDGEFYLTNVYLSDGITGTIFKTKDPYSSESWSDAVTWNATSIDPDLFFDDDGQVYLTSAGIVQQTIDVETGEVSDPVSIWNGTGASSPEGPHVYKKDGWYYLMIAEGGTELGHRETIARSKNVSGPWEANPANPILTNSNTTEYFQTVGHADLFQDGEGRWWGMSLATRSGPAWEIYPMGREAVLFPVTWEEGRWPVASQVQGVMNGWPLPQYSKEVEGEGPWVGEPDNYDFAPGSQIPGNWVFWRYPNTSSFEISPAGGLLVRPSRMNLTGNPNGSDFALTGKMGLSFIGRRQEETLFKYSVDLSFNPQEPEQETGVTVFLTQLNHMELGISPSSTNSSDLEFRFRVNTDGTTNATFSSPGFTGTPNSPIPSYNRSIPVPSHWTSPFRLQISTVNDTYYSFSVFPVGNPNELMILAQESALIVSGGSGPFTGALVGVYATCNGAGEFNSTICPGDGGEVKVGRWRYEGIAQEYSKGGYQFGERMKIGMIRGRWVVPS